MAAVKLSFEGIIFRNGVDKLKMDEKIALLSFLIPAGWQTRVGAENQKSCENK